MCWLAGIVGDNRNRIGKRAELRFGCLEKDGETLGGGEDGPEMVAGRRQM